MEKLVKICQESDKSNFSFVKRYPFFLATSSHLILITVLSFFTTCLLILTFEGSLTFSKLFSLIVFLYRCDIWVVNHWTDFSSSNQVVIGQALKIWAGLGPAPGLSPTIFRLGAFDWPSNLLDKTLRF